MGEESIPITEGFDSIAGCVRAIESNGGRIHAIEPAGETFASDGELRVRFSVAVPSLSELASEGITLLGDDLTVTDDGTCLLEFTVSVPLSDQTGETRQDRGPIPTAPVSGGSDSDSDPSEDGETADGAGGAATGVTGDDTTAVSNGGTAVSPGEASDVSGERDSGSDDPGEPSDGADGSTGSGDEGDDPGTTDGSHDPPERQEDAGDGDVPYRDPERLAAVYEEHETFREMRNALGVDVTPQTVRRHMIDHGIHEVSSNPSVELQRGPESSGSPTGEAGIGREADDTESPKDRTDDGSHSADDTADERGEDRSDSPTIEGDGGVPVVEDADLPDDLTITAVKEAVRTSRTVREAQHQLGISEAETRVLLQDLDLLDLVIGRLAGDGDEAPTDAELNERIRNAVAGNER